MGRPSLTDPDLTPLTASTARCAAHRPNPEGMNKLNRNVQAEPDPWSSWENAHPNLNPNYPAITRWMDKNIPAFLRNWDIPVGDLCPATHELPDLPIHPDPSPPYFRARAEEPGTAPPELFALWRETLSISLPGQTRILTAIQDPLSDEEDFLTPHLSLIHSPIHTPSNWTMTPSTQEGETMNGWNLGTSTEKSSVPTAPLPGNSGNRTSSDNSSGPTAGTPESTWTSTSLPRVET
ncbi:hypothetical protein ARMGADRAFT_1022684 [Armillaria gallica]|uniref:Uncharacterized protein n=1 Tax=Armillaria gallica TaxID=47427 RepID=A0A2H3EV39_ARMGA|nr:hypothetical protein ARMGADRAFT_1022684 [Armillaria gallica]